MSVNEFVGRSKAFHEEMRHFTGIRYQQLFLENRGTNGGDQAQSIKKPTMSKYPAGEA